MAVYIGHTRENNGESFFLTEYQSKEDEEKHGLGAISDADVVGVYRVEMPLEIEQMSSVLKAIDSATDTCLVQNLFALVFEAGYLAGKAVK